MYYILSNKEIIFRERMYFVQDQYARIQQERSISWEMCGCMLMAVIVVAVELLVLSVPGNLILRGD